MEGFSGWGFEKIIVGVWPKFKIWVSREMSSFFEVID